MSAATCRSVLLNVTFTTVGPVWSDVLWPQQQGLMVGPLPQP
jgi:hypothetical protein